MKITTNLFLRFLKLLDIGYITAIYFTLGVMLAAFTDYLFGEFDPAIEDTKSFIQISLEAIGLMWLFGIIVYTVRNLVELIPSPVNGISGFDHLLVKELKNATVFVFVFLFFQNFFKSKIVFYYNKFYFNHKSSRDPNKD